MAVAMLHRFVDRQLLFAVEARAERLALDVRHHVEQQSVGFARVEQRQEVRVLQVGRDLDLGEEPLDADDRAELRLQDLERDLAVVPDVAREIDRRHSAFTHKAVDDVAAREPRVQLVG